MVHELFVHRDPTWESDPRLAPEKRLAAYNFLCEGRDAVLQYRHIPVDANFSPGIIQIIKPSNASDWSMSLQDKMGDLQVISETKMGCDELCIRIKYKQLDTSWKLKLVDNQLDPNASVITIGKAKYLISQLD